MWALCQQHSAADRGGFRLQNLRFFQPETQNYAWILRSVPTEHMLVGKLHTSRREVVIARTPGRLPESGKHINGQVAGYSIFILR